MTGQVGGDHYSVKEGLDHLAYAHIRNFDPFQYIITKWVERWKKKGGVEDLRKAQHALERYIEIALQEEVFLQAQKAGIKFPNHARDCAYVVEDGPAPCTCHVMDPSKPGPDYVDQD